MKIDKEMISKKAWGDVDKATLGRRLAEAYAAGDVTKAQIREVYAYVPDEAFESGDDGPTFAHTKAWGPHHEVSGETITLNRGGVHAAAGALAGARAEPSLSGEALAAAKRHIKRHYRSHLEEDVPDGLKESRRQIGRGQPLEELVKGSLEYTQYMINQAFRNQFESLLRAEDNWFYIAEVFASYVIVGGGNDLAADEYYYVTYRRDGDSYVFAGRDDWEIVEMAYRPQTTSMGERRKERSAAGERFVETLVGSVRLMEEAAGDKPDGPWRIKAVGITADVVNENGRRYPAPVLEAAVQELRTHLHESAGQGRVMQLYGESEHPSIKAARRPFLPEVVVNWDRVVFDGRQILLEGNLLGTAAGKDIRAQMLGGVVPGVSQRGYGESHKVTDNGRPVEEVDWLIVTGYDLTVEPSDPTAGITMFESRQEDGEMELNLELLREKYPELVAQLLQEHDEKKRKQLEEILRAKQLEEEHIQKMLAEREKALRAELGLKDTDNLQEALRQREQRLNELEEKEQARAVAAYIEEQTKDVGYPDWLRAQMVEAIQATKPATVDEAKLAIVAKRKEYDGIMAKLELAAQGYRGDIRVLGPVLERETGVPEFAKGAYLLTEAMVNAGQAKPRKWNKEPTEMSVNERFAKLYLERFDRDYRQHLLAEARLIEEAEQTSDLSLPYSVARAVMAEAVPELVAVSIFDVGLTDQSPSRLYYEAYAHETGVENTVTAESVTITLLATWYAMAHKRVEPGTVTVTNAAATVTYVEGTDYVIDYGGGRVRGLVGGGITATDVVLVTYTYEAMREGEMSVIQRGKLALTYKTLEIAADRLATQISSEAVEFARSQLGWDATGRTLAALVREIRERIDKHLLYMALSAALAVANNSGGTWSATPAGGDTYQQNLDKLFRYIGVAKVKVANRFYPPDFILTSWTTSDVMSNSELFTAAGKRPDVDLNAAGYLGRAKGLPVFSSTQFGDAYIVVGNREIVQHRIFKAMLLKGPFPTYDVSGGTSKLVAADQWYAEEYNGSDSPILEKAAYVKLTS